MGAGPGGNGQNVARLFILLKNWEDHASADRSSFAIIERATKAFDKIPEAKVLANNPAAISGLGNAAGFDLMLEDHSGIGHDALMAARDQLLSAATNSPLLTRVRHNGLDDSPQLQIDIDQRKAQALGVSVDDINDTLQTAWGSSYVNDFLDRGRVKRVYVQAAAKYRMLPQDIYRWYVRNSSGSMVPFSAFASSRWEYGAPRLERYNGYASLEIVGEAAPGVSSGARWTKWRNWCANCLACLGWNGQPCLIKSGYRAPKRRRCTPSRCWWCSFVWRRCTKAGQSPSRSCWWFRWACWAR